MFEWFTERALKAMVLAQEESRLSGHNYLGTEQILLGLLGLGDGVAFRALRAAGVTLEAARAELSKLIPDGSDIVGEDIPFTPRCKRLLELAWDEARQLRHNYISTEHVLLGLMREGEGFAVRALENLGVDLTELRTHVLEILSFNAEANNSS